MKNIIFFIGLLILYSSGGLRAQTTCSDTVVYNTGTVPLFVSAGNIYAGSTAGSGGSGVVIIQSNQSTSFAAVQTIWLQPNFLATVTDTATFSAYIVPCASERVMLTKGNAQAYAALPANFRIYPTIGTGGVTITGSAIDLLNLDIFVYDEQGRVVFKTHNTANTQVSLNLGNLRNGHYFLQLKKNSQQVIRKIIISN